MPSGWHAEIALRFARRRERTVLAARHQRGPLMVQRPFYPEGGDVCHTYLLHPPAGIVGGDDLKMTFELDTGAHGLLTTPSATRWYFSRGLDAQVEQQARLADGSTLEWLPQETLLFDGAHARLATRINLTGSARFCGWEIVGLGRPACGESFRNGRIDFRFELFRNGLPLLLERLRGGAGGLPGLRGYAAYATFLASSASATALEAAREILGAAPETLCGATLVGDILVGRGLAARCEPLIHTFTKLWSALRPLLLGRVAVPPRIWHT
jgi:urease accessory protein